MRNPTMSGDDLRNRPCRQATYLVSEDARTKCCAASFLVMVGR